MQSNNTVFVVSGENTERVVCEWLLFLRDSVCGDFYVNSEIGFDSVQNLP